MLNNETEEIMDNIEGNIIALINYQIRKNLKVKAKLNGMTLNIFVELEGEEISNSTIKL